MSIAFAQWHFLRPEWLWALIPCVLAWWLLFRQKHQGTQWQQLIDPELLESMTKAMPLSASQPHQYRFGLYTLLLSWILGVVALAGPSWEQLPVPANTNADALIIALDLSYSMLAEDVKPSRLERAKFKINDLLDHRGEGYTALIAYAGDAHVVSPLTQDTNTVRNLVNPLSPLIMPAPGSRPDKAIQLAETLRAQTGLPKARTLLITDDIIEIDIARIKKLPLDSMQLSLLAIGTAAGAPINIPNRGFLRNRSGELILPTMNYDLIEQLADATHARVAKLSVGDNDWRYLIPEDVQFAQPRYQQQRQNIDQWRDAGTWLVLGLLPFAALSFRRGWLFALTLTLLLPFPQPSMAFEWQDLWRTPDQQAQALYETDPKAAADKFNNIEWRGIAHYQAGDYEQAIDSWKSIDNANSAYNLGNAYAKTNQLTKAIAAYQRALALQSPFPEAQENLDYVEALLKHQQQNPEQEGNSENTDKPSSISNDQQNQTDQQSQQQQNDSDDPSRSNQGASDQSKGSESTDTQSSGTQNQNAQNTDQQEQKTTGDPAKQPASEATPSSASQQESSASEDINEALANDQQQSQQAPNLRDLEKAQAKHKDQKAADTEPQQGSATPLISTKDLKNQLDPEQYQALQQWLNRVPEDPSGLLERKFLYEYKKRQMQQTEQESKVW